ncbi:MAG TPA: branched-chain amino acid ABC transporter permease [Acidimicrobiales bacterium]|nr:branched-chain amino acid ABC transporter permease [Acidimicrobiales bacterium]
MFPYVVTGILSGAAYGLLAMGFVLVYKGTKTFNLAHGEIGGAGLYVAWALLDRVPVIVASLAGVAVSGLVAVTMERALVRRVSRQGALAGMAVTLGAGLSLAHGEALLFGYNVKTFPSPVGRSSFSLGSATVTAPRLAALVTLAVAGAGLALLLRRTRLGLAVRAATSDPALARLSGVSVGRSRSLVWGLAGMLSGTAAVLLACVYTFHPLSATLVMVRALAAALLGGLSSLGGAVVGGLAVGLVESLVVANSSTPGLVDAAIFTMILATLLVRPQGMLGARAA